MRPGVQVLRVLHINAGNLYGGVETSLLAMAKHRAVSRNEHVFAVCFEGKYSRMLRETGAHVFKLPETRISRPLTVWRARKQVKDLIARERVDAVLCHMPWSLAIFGPACQRAGAGLVFWVHDIHHGKHPIERWGFLTRPDVCIVNSGATGKALDPFLPGVPRATVYPPVETKRRELDLARVEVRGALGVNNSQKVILQVSRMEAWKGQHLLLKSLRLIANREDWVCWIVGGAQRPAEQEYFETLKSSARALGIEARVRFLGQRTDVMELLAAADIYCQPNAAPEPFGISFIEALSMALPVVTFAMGGPGEIVDASCGLLAEPGNIEEIAHHLCTLLASESLCKELGQNGPARAWGISDPAIQMPNLDDILAQSLPRNRAANQAPESSLARMN